MHVTEYKQPSCLGQLINLFLAFALAISVVLAVLLFLAEIQLLNPRTYQQALAEEDIYSRLPGLAAEQIAASLASEGESLNGAPNFLSQLGQEEWKPIVEALLPPEWVRAQAEGVIDQAFADLDAGLPVQIEISLIGLKQGLTEDKLSMVARQVLLASPPCTADELMTMGSIAMGLSNAPVPVCMPSEELQPLVEGAAVAILQGMATALPDQVSIGLTPGAENAAQANPPGAGNGAQSGAALGGFRTMRLLFLASPLLPLVLLALLTLSAVRSWQGLGRWWGVPLLLAGLLLLVLAAFGLVSFRWMADILVIDRIPVLSAGFAQALEAVSQNVAGRYGVWVGIAGGAFSLAGMALLLFSWVVRPGYRLP